MLRAALLLLASISAPPNEYPTYSAPRVLDPPVLDARLDDPCWQSAPVLSGLVTNASGDPARFPTEFRFVYTGEALYCAVRCLDPEPEHIRARDRNTEKAWWDDNIEIFLDPLALRSRYFQFLVTPADVLVSSYNGDFAAEIPGETKTAITEEGWTSEVRMPFTTFGSVPTPGEKWGMNVTRSRVGRETVPRETTLWSRTHEGHGSPGRFGYLVFSTVPGAKPPREEPDLTAADRILEQIMKETHGYWRWTDADVNFQARTARARDLIALSPTAAFFPEETLLAFVRPAIVDEHILPWSVPAPPEIGKPIELTACRGEFESASLGVFALRDLEGVTLSHSDLTSPEGNSLPASIADAFHVIPWYQSGSGTIFQSRTTLQAELLMKDPTLVTVDPKTRVNILDFDPMPEDAKTLEPIDVPAFESRQFWITYRIPPDAHAGDYRGTVTLKTRSGLEREIPVRLTVPDWDLEPSPMWHGLYYGLRMEGIDSLEKEQAFFARFDAEIRNQIEHGCNTVATYVGVGPTFSNPSPFATAEHLHALQSEYGITGTPYICIVFQIGFQTGEDLERLREQAGVLNQWAVEHGYAGFYYHGMDEASGDALARERESFQAVREAGAHVFVACKPSFFDVVGEYLDLPNVTGRLHPELADRVHQLGHRITSYGNPQTGVELPNVYRRNYGLALRAAGYDGSVNYTYTTIDPKGSWDDYDDESNYRDHNFAYPAEEKPIDTIQFEGWREAVDDVRYAATLEKAIKTAPAEESALADESQAWLDSLTGFEDLYAVREEMISRIEQLR